jgi:hypothetical protein
MVVHRDDISASSKRLKIEANGDTIVPLLIDVFKDVKNAISRLEIIEYINWIYEEYGFRNTISLSRVFFQHLQTTTAEEIDNETDIKVDILFSFSLSYF